MQREYEVMGRKLQIHLGDITQLEVDAIVSSENSDLVMDELGGPSVSGAIRRAEGNQIAAALARLGPIEPGRAVLTPSTELPCRWIVHAASVVKTEVGHHSSLTIIREAVRSSLQLAAGLGLESIAFPAFGVRATNITPAQASVAMVQELVAGLKGQTPLRRIVIALIDPESFLHFFEEAMKRGTQANEPLVLRVDLDAHALEFAFHENRPISQTSEVAFTQSRLKDLRSLVRRLRPSGTRRLRDQGSELTSLGAQVWSLLPSFVQTRLREETTRPLVLKIDEGVCEIPFELAWDGERHLVEERQVSRLLVVQSHTSVPHHPPSDAVRLETLLLTGQVAALPGAAREAEFLLDLLWRRAVRRTRATLLADRRATRRAVLDALSGVDLLHWCGHTEGVDGVPSWSLADGEFLQPKDVEGLRLKAELILANSCGPEDGAQMARAFLVAGARNYIGTLWDVEDEVARRFALRFYEELFLGRTIGDALAAARASIRETDPLHWAAYLHYGDPNDRLFEPTALSSQG